MIYGSSREQVLLQPARRERVDAAAVHVAVREVRALIAFHRFARL